MPTKRIYGTRRHIHWTQKHKYNECFVCDFRCVVCLCDAEKARVAGTSQFLQCCSLCFHNKLDSYARCHSTSPPPTLLRTLPCSHSFIRKYFYNLEATRFGRRSKERHHIKALSKHVAMKSYYRKSEGMRLEIGWNWEKGERMQTATAHYSQTERGNIVCACRIYICRAYYNNKQDRKFVRPTKGNTHTRKNHQKSGENALVSDVCWFVDLLSQKKIEAFSNAYACIKHQGSVNGIHVHPRYSIQFWIQWAHNALLPSLWSLLVGSPSWYLFIR